jgi:hypothetical protein
MKIQTGSVILCLLCIQFGLQQSIAQRAQKQTTFCEDGAPDDVAFKAESLPKAVIDAVMNSDEGKQARADADQSGKELNPEKVLRATKFPLSSDSATVFLVMGSYPLSAADASWFWIVREDGAKASVLLWMAGNCVELKPSRTHGYRDIEVLWASAGSKRTETYRYDGKAYQLARSRTKDRGSND